MAYFKAQWVTWKQWLFVHHRFYVESRLPHKIGFVFHCVTCKDTINKVGKIKADAAFGSDVTAWLHVMTIWLPNYNKIVHEIHYMIARVIKRDWWCGWDEIMRFYRMHPKDYAHALCLAIFLWIDVCRFCSRPLGLLHWHCSNHTIAPALTKQPWGVFAKWAKFGRWRHQMETFSALRALCADNSPVNSPHKGQSRRALMVSLICALNKRLSKQSWGWWFETPSRSLWRHCNVHREKRM